MRPRKQEKSKCGKCSISTGNTLHGLAAGGAVRAAWEGAGAG